MPPIHKVYSHLTVYKVFSNTSVQFLELNLVNRRSIKGHPKFSTTMKQAEQTSLFLFCRWTFLVEEQSTKYEFKWFLYMNIHMNLNDVNNKLIKWKPKKRSDIPRATCFTGKKMPRIQIFSFQCSFHLQSCQEESILTRLSSSTLFFPYLEGSHLCQPRLCPQKLPQIW